MRRSPFSIFRKHQKMLLATLTIVAMFLFVVADSLYQFADRLLAGGSAEDPVVVESEYGSLTRSELNMLVARRQLANAFLSTLRMFGARAPLFGEADAESVVDSWLLRQEAQRRGVVVTDNAVGQFIRSDLSGGLVSSRQMLETICDLVARQTQYPLTPAEAMDILRDELLALQVQRLAGLHQYDSVQTITPEQLWDYYRRLHERITLDVVAVRVDDFIAQAGEPTDEQIREFYEAHKDELPEPDSPEPGLAVPRRLQVAYIQVPFDRIRAEIEPEITDEDLQAFYDEYQYLYAIPASTEPVEEPDAPILPTLEPEPGDEPAAPSDAPPDARPEAPPVEPAAPADQSPAPPADPSPAPPADQPASPSEAGAPAAPEAPEAGGPSLPCGQTEAAPEAAAPLALLQDDAPATPQAPASPSEAEQPDSAQAEAEPAQSEPGQPAQPAPQEGEPPPPSSEAETPPARGEEAGSTAAHPAETGEAGEPTEGGDEPAAETAAPVGQGEAPAEPPTPQYYPLDEVRDDVRRRVVEQRARERIRDRLGQIVRSDAYETYARDLRTWRDALREVRFTGETSLPEGVAYPDQDALTSDLRAYAQQQGFAFGLTALAGLDELQHHPQIGEAHRVSGRAGDVAPDGRPYPIDENEERTFAGEPLMQALTATQLGLYEDLYAEDADLNGYVVWKVQDHAGGVPKLTTPGGEMIPSTRRRVAEAWRRQQARELARAEAERLADEARRAAATLRETFEPQGVAVLSTGPFQWLVESTARGTNPTVSPPARLGEVPSNVEQAGEDFMRGAFALAHSGAGPRIGVLSNAPGTVFYVAEVIRHEPADRDAFLADADSLLLPNSAYSHLAREAEREALDAFVEQLRRRANLTWQLSPNNYNEAGTD